MSELPNDNIISTPSRGNTNQNNRTSENSLPTVPVTPPTSEVVDSGSENQQKMDVQTDETEHDEGKEKQESNNSGADDSSPDKSTAVVDNSVADSMETLSVTENDEFSLDLSPCDTSSNSEQLQVKLPPVQKSSVPSSEPEASGGQRTAADGVDQNGTKSSDPSESVYHIKWVYFKKKLVPIITQNENGPCPLLAILNVLLLQSRVKLAEQSEFITANQLMTHLGECVLDNVPNDESLAASSRLNFQQNMQDAMVVMPKLQTGLDVNVRFTGVKDFEYTTECIVFDLLQISLYHGWLVDPQNKQEVEAVGKCSYNQLVEKIITQKSSEQTDVISQALIAEQFLETSASQLTYHGLSELCTQLKDDELAVLFRNNHFTTLYRRKDELFQLVTDQGFLTESNVVWETLSNVEGDCHFVDSEFRTYTKPEPAHVDPPDIPLNSSEQIDQDYLVALSLQEEQQQHQQQEPMAWTPQQMPQLSDLELAQSLQEEERRAAEMEEAQMAQNEQAGGRSAPQQSSQPRRRRDEPRAEREEKKSDCCIL